MARGRPVHGTANVLAERRRGAHGPARHRRGTYRPAAKYGGECLGVYFLRLIRDDWTFLDSDRAGRLKDHAVFEKPVRDGWVLRKIAHAQIDPPIGKGVYWDEHELVHVPSDTLVRCLEWEWADLDGKRLVWAAEGKLFTGTLSRARLASVAVLYDFGPVEYEPIKAPY